MSIVEILENSNPIVVNSHPRSGTHLLIDFLRRQYAECAIKKTWNRGLDDLYFSIEGLLDDRADSLKVEQKGLRILASCKSPLVKYHCYSESTLEERFPDWMDYLAKAKSIYVYRNLYDVLCSTYIYMQTFENSGKGVSLSEFIRQPFARSTNRVAFWVNEINKKKTQKNTLLISYETIVSQPDKVLDTLDAYLGMHAKRLEPMLPPKTYNKWNMRWQRLFSRYPHNTAILASSNGTSKLKPQSAFSADDFSFINTIAATTMVSLGYQVMVK